MNLKATHKNIKDLTISAVCLALCMILPFFVGQLPEFARAISPMHIPVLLAGFAVGPLYAAIIGLIAPLLRFTLFGMPGMPMGAAMAFELATYGIISGVLYKAFPKKIAFIYVSLIIAMFIGRCVWVVVMARITTDPTIIGSDGLMYTAFVTAIPGIILHIVLIPVIVIALRRAKLLE